MSGNKQPEVAIISPIKYVINDVVEHIASAGIYVVAGLPTEYVIEATREPAYSYRMADGRKAVRCQVEFEQEARFRYLGRAENLGLPIEPIPVPKVRSL
jgi:hypothetical protein